MKKNLIIFTILVAAIAGCKPEKFPDIGDPLNKLQNIEGSWQVERVVQSDLNAIRYNFPYKELDVTAVAPFTQFKVNITRSGNTGTFTTTPGSSPNFIPLADGKWEVDDPNAPVALNFIKGTDTVKLQFGSYNTLVAGKLHLRIIKGIDGKNLLRYDYYFKKN